MRHSQAMNAHLPSPQPDLPPHLVIRWQDLESAWRMLTAPDKQDRIDDTLATLQALSLGASPGKLAFTLIAATAWLTDDTADNEICDKDWSGSRPPSGSG